MKNSEELKPLATGTGHIFARITAGNALVVMCPLVTSTPGQLLMMSSMAPMAGSHL